MMDTLAKGLYEEATDLLHDMGTLTHIKGHYYLCSAILEVYVHPELLKNMTNGLHVTITKACDTAPSRMERSIRSIIEVTPDHEDVDLLYSVFRNTISKNEGKPTNRESIMMAVNVLRARYIQPALYYWQDVWLQCGMPYYGETQSVQQVVLAMPYHFKTQIQVDRDTVV